LEGLHNHIVIVGYGRVGRVVGSSLAERDIPMVVIEQNKKTVEELQGKGIPVIYGDAEAVDILNLAKLKEARFFVITPLDSFQARQLVNSAWQVNPEINIVVRTHNEEERRYLESFGGPLAIMGDPELAKTLSGYILERYS
jgi:CPA2 family monovalent cation:H+ antiporter-2